MPNNYKIKSYFDMNEKAKKRIDELLNERYIK